MKLRMFSSYLSNFIHPEEIITRTLNDEVTFKQQPFSLFKLSKNPLCFLSIVQDIRDWKSIHLFTALSSISISVILVRRFIRSRSGGSSILLGFYLTSRLFGRSTILCFTWYTKETDTRIDFFRGNTFRIVENVFAYFTHFRHRHD